MSRSIRICLAVALASAPFAVACDKSGTDAQAQVNQAQNKANTEVANANTEANTKAAQAQSEADKKIAAVQADFATTREDYRHQVQSNIVALNKQLDELDVKVKTVSATTKPDLRATLPALRAQRDAFLADFQTMSTTTALTWDATKARLDKEWADLKAAVDKAS